MTKILVVDDEKDFSQMVKFNLEEFGKYEVVSINSAVDALSAAVRHRPDLILMDIIMPKLEGPDVYAEMKRNSDVRDIPIIFLTATVTRDEVDAQEGEIGGHRFLAKGGSIPELIRCIEEALKDAK